MQTEHQGICPSLIKIVLDDSYPGFGSVAFRFESNSIYALVVVVFHLFLIKKMNETSQARFSSKLHQWKNFKF